MGMKFDQLHTLVAVADAGSIRGASRTLKTSPAAVTKSIQRLEAETSLQIINRNASGITFTDDGRNLLIQARLLVAQMATAQQVVSDMQGELSGRLAVAVTPWLAMTLMPKAIQLFSRRYPSVRLDLYEGLPSIAYQGLRDGSIDLFIGRLDSQLSNVELTYSPIFTSDCAVVARQGHPLAEVKSLYALYSADWILTAPPEGDFATHAKVHLAHSIAITLSMLRETDMLSIFPWPLVEVCAKREGLCTLPVREPVSPALVGAITRSGQPMRPAAQRFLECMISVIKEEAHDLHSNYQRVFRTVDLLV